MPSLEYERRRRTIWRAFKEDGSPSIAEVARRIGRHKVYVYRVLSGNDTSSPVLDQLETELMADKETRAAA